MNAHANQRIVITGLGVISALGNDPDRYFDQLAEGKSGISKVDAFDPTDYPSQVGGQVRDFDPNDYMDPKEAKRNDRYTQFAVAAARQAYAQAGISEGADVDRIGVLVGSGIGGMNTIETQSHRLFEKGPRKVSPFMIPSLIANIASGVVAIELGLRGPNFGIVSACATASHAIGESMRILKSGEADMMLAGGSEAAITRLGYAGFCAMKAMSTQFNDRPEEASRPFDQDRDGFIMGEGAGVLVLETLEHAQKRNATILCELIGYAASCDAYHITAPDPDGLGLQSCLRKALRHAAIRPEDVDYVNAHGTSTPYNDKSESMALKKVFGDHAYTLKVSSTKSMTGHLLGAAGAIEAIACIKAIEKGVLPPTINYQTPDPECDLDYVPNTKQAVPIRTAMSTNLGFGGQNAAVLFKRFDGV